MAKTSFCAYFLHVGLVSLGIAYCAWFILINGPLREEKLDVESAFFVETQLLSLSLFLSLTGGLPVFCLYGHISSEESLMK